MPAERLASEHEVLTLDIDRLHLVVSSPEGALPEPRMRRVVTRELLDLCAALQQHFAIEEQVAESPTTARGRPEPAALAALHSDHRRILGKLRHLADAARDLPIDVLKLRISDALGVLGERR